MRFDSWEFWTLASLPDSALTMYGNMISAIRELILAPFVHWFRPPRTQKVPKGERRTADQLTKSGSMAPWPRFAEGRVQARQAACVPVGRGRGPFGRLRAPRSVRGMGSRIPYAVGGPSASGKKEGCGGFAGCARFYEPIRWPLQAKEARLP